MATTLAKPMQQHLQVAPTPAGTVVQQEQAIRQSQVLTGYSHYQGAAAAAPYHPPSAVAIGSELRSSHPHEHQYPLLTSQQQQHQGNLINGSDFTYTNHYHQHGQFFDYCQQENNASYHQQPASEFFQQRQAHDQVVGADHQLYATGAQSNPQLSHHQYPQSYATYTDTYEQQSVAYIQHRQMLNTVAVGAQPVPSDQGRSTDANEFSSLRAKFLSPNGHNCSAELSDLETAENQETSNDAQLEGANGHREQQVSLGDKDTLESEPSQILIKRDPNGRQLAVNLKHKKRPEFHRYRSIRSPKQDSQFTEIQAVSWHGRLVGSEKTTFEQNGRYNDITSSALAASAESKCVDPSSSVSVDSQGESASASGAEVVSSSLTGPTFSASNITSVLSSRDENNPPVESTYSTTSEVHQAINNIGYTSEVSYHQLDRKLADDALCHLDRKQTSSSSHDANNGDYSQLSLVQPQKSASSQPELSNSEDGGRFKSYCIGEEARGIVGTINLPALVSILEMRKEKSRDAARSRRSKENHEFYELAKLLPLPAAITSQLDFLDKASIIRLTISFLKLRQFSVNGHPPWAPDFTTLGSINPYSSQSLSSYAEHYSSASLESHQSRPTSVKPQALKSGYGAPSSAVDDLPGANGSSQLMTASVSVLPSSIAFNNSIEQASSATYRHLTPVCHAPDPTGSIALAEKKNNSLFDIHQGTHILQSLDGFAFAIGRDGRFLYISETVSMYLGLSQVEMTGSSVFDYTHQQDHEELANQLGIPYTLVKVGSVGSDFAQSASAINPSGSESPQPASVHSQYSVASNETLIDEHVNLSCPRKRAKVSNQPNGAARGAYGRGLTKRPLVTSSCLSGRQVTLKIESEENNAERSRLEYPGGQYQGSFAGTEEDPLVRQFCIRMKSTLTKRGCQHFKSSGYRVVHVVAHLRSYQSNDHGHLMDPLDDQDQSGDTGLSTKHSNSKRRCGIRASSSSVSLTKSDIHNKKKSAGSDKCSSHEQASANSTTSSTDSSVESPNSSAAYNQPAPKIIGMVAVAIALPPPSINELKLESDTFVLRLSLDLRITHIEPRITELLNFPVESIAGKSLYSIVHPADVHQVQKCHHDLLRKGQMMSGYYRILSRSGGYIWIQTCATLICNSNIIASQSPAILSASPLPAFGSQTGTSQQYLSQSDLQCKMAGFSSSQEHQPQQHSYQQQASKVVSPGLSSHLSSNYDQTEQDQCIIFVNYMITNTVDSSDILDVCQCADYQSMSSSSFSGSTSSSTTQIAINPTAGNAVQSSSHLNESNNQFSSPSSSCPSPCLKNMIANNSSTSSGGSNNSRSYPPNVVSTNSIGMNLSSLKRQVHQFCDTKHKDKSLHYVHRRSSGSSSKLKSTMYSATGSIDGVEHVAAEASRQSLSSSGSATGWLDTAKSTDSSAYEQANSVSEPHHMYSYAPSLSNVNMALNCVNATNKSQVGDSSPWLNHHQSAAVVVAARLGDPVSVYAASQQTPTVPDPYTTVNRSSLYKAAFGLEVSANGATTTYQPSSYSSGGPTGYTNSTASNSTTSWDTSAAVAAVAAASNLGGHHPSNPYAHLDTHPAGLNSTTGGHHNPGSYYNYYGYYGNKFI